MKRTKVWRTLLFLISIFGICLVVLVKFEPHILSANTAHQDPSKPDVTFDLSRDVDSGRKIKL